MNEIFQYRQEGQIYLWKYKINKNFPGYQMAWSVLGRDSFLMFLDQLENSESGTFRTLQVSAPTAAILSVPNSKVNEILSIEKLRVQISSEIDWSFTVEGATCNIIVSSALVREWAQTIRAVKSQVELSFRGIYFWW